jgi:hypothetical protein
MITAQQIEDAVTYRDSFGFESSVFLPLLADTVTLSVNFDNETETISDRQIRILKQFLAYPPVLLRQVKEALMGHFREYDDWQNVNNCQYDSADEAYEASTPIALHLPACTDPDPDFPILSFSPAWDPEHGAEVWFYEGQFRFR